MRGVRVWASVIAGALLAFSAAVALAGGGGGACHGTKTEGSGVEVALQDLCFQPTLLYVTPGQKVTWNNLDSVDHTVTSATYVWENRTLQRGDTFSWTFKDPGIYPYFCLFHSYMGGAVVVGELDVAQKAFLSALDQRQQDLLANLDDREEGQQDVLLAILDAREEALKQSLLEGGWAQAIPWIAGIAILGTGLGGAALILALRRKG